MLIKIPRGWEISENDTTSERLFADRRRLVKGLVAGPTMLAAGGLLAACGEEGPASKANAAEVSPKSLAGGFEDPTADLYPVTRNLRYRVERELTPENLATTYNNFYEFGSQKSIHEAAQKLPLRPWEIKIDGMVEKETTIDIDKLVRTLPLEERVYRFRCVEAWAMTVPWSGIPMAKLVEMAKPLGSAKYVQMQTFMDPDAAPAQRLGFGYPWPYTEGLTMAEATNELTLLVTGAYGKPALPQNGAPIRLITPWKYGFKQVKSIVRFTFTDKMPKTFWMDLGPREYGFWANINPEVPHPRWSQATERLLSDGPSMLWPNVPTQKWGGYGEYVASIYDGMDEKTLFY